MTVKLTCLTYYLTSQISEQSCQFCLKRADERRLSCGFKSFIRCYKTAARVIRIGQQEIQWLKRWLSSKKKLLLLQGIKVSILGPTQKPLPGHCDPVPSLTSISCTHDSCRYIQMSIHNKQNFEKEKQIIKVKNDLIYHIYSDIKSGHQNRIVPQRALFQLVDFSNVEIKNQNG